MMIKQLAIGTGLVLAATVAVTSPALSQTQNSQGQAFVLTGTPITGPEPQRCSRRRPSLAGQILPG